MTGDAVGESIGELRVQTFNAPSSPHGALASSTAPWWTAERALYGVALLIGGWLRMLALGAQPLSPWEASNSWPAWLVANGLMVTDAPAPTSALYYNLQWLLFWAGVNSDSGARFLSAVAGTLLLVLPWWWRGLLGRRTALILAYLFAFDPWLLAFGRLADGASLALALGLLILVGMWQVVERQGHAGWHKTVAISAGLLLISGPMGWNFVPIVLWWGWLLRDGLAQSGLWRRHWLVWSVGAALLGATLGFARLDGIEWIASGMSLWLAQFDGRSAGPLLPTIMGGYDMGWPWLRLVVDAALVLPLGIGGLAILWLRAEREGWRLVGHESRAVQLMLLCGGWLLWGVLLALLPGRSPFALPMIGLPLLILCAIALDDLLRTVPLEIDWREAAAVMLTLTILLASGLIWVTALLANRNYDPVLAQAALVIFGLALAILVAFGVWANRRDAAWIAATMATVLLLALFVRSSWKLNFADMSEEPAGWQAIVAHPEMRLLAGDVETLSAHRAGDPHQLPVQVQMAPYSTMDDQLVPTRPDPVVGWQLRNMRNLTWVSAPQVAEDADPLPLVLTPAAGEDEATGLDLPPTYAGSRYHVDAWWLPRTLAREAEPEVAEEDGFDAVARQITGVVQPWWRWFVYREPTVAPQNRDVILWAPVDATP